MTETELFSNALNIEKFFCDDNLLKLRQAFGWIEFGKYVSKVNTYSPYDGLIVWEHPEGSPLLVGRFDFKHSTRNGEETIKKFSIKNNCHTALKHQKNSLLIIHAEPSELLYAIDYDRVKTGPSQFEDSLELLNLRECIIDSTRFPLS